MSRVIGVLLLAPLAAFAVEAAQGTPHLTLNARAWGHTLAIAGGAALLSLAMGIPAGLALAHTRRRWPLALTLMPLIVPPALAAAMWMGLRLPGPGLLGCAAILAANLWPVVALLLAAALTRIPRAELDAAELQLDPRQTARRVVWPHARPALLAGTLLVFLLAASDFTVPATFAITTTSTVVYERLSAFDFAGGAVAALPLVILAIALAFVVRRAPVLPQPGRSRPFLRGAPLSCAWAVAAAAWLATAAGPAFVFARTVRSPATFMNVMGVNADSLLWSAAIAGVAAVALVAWASLTPRRSAMEPLWLAGLVLPGIVPALGALLLANRLGVQPPLTESGALLVLALMTRFAYVAWLPLRQPVEPTQLEAAELCGLPRARSWRKIVLPALLPRALATGAIVFVLCLGEIGPAVLLSPPGRQTVVQHLFNWMHYGYDETVASLALVMLAAAAVIAWVGTHVGRTHHAPVVD